MTSFASLKWYLFAVSLIGASTALPASAYHSSSKNLGVGAVQCSYILAYQENPAAQKDIRMWVQKFVDQVNEEMSSKRSPKEQVALSPELQWFATLLYCGLDPKQPLVKATMRMIDAEWDKMQEQKKQPS